MQRRSLRIVFFVFALLLLTIAVQYGTLLYLEKHWDEVVERKTAEQLQEVNTAFTDVQREVRRIASELARHADITSYLLQHSDNVSLVFNQAAKISRNRDVSTEVYDRDGNLIAWYGRSGAVRSDEVRLALRGVLTSYVTRDPIYAQLFVISPVRVETDIVGAVIVRRAVEVNYPLSNKFIRPAGLAEELSQRLGVTVEVEYGEYATQRKDGRYSSGEIIGIDGEKLGVANILRLSRGAYLESVSEEFYTVIAALLVLLILFSTIMSVRLIERIPQTALRSLIVTLLIWALRYLLLLLEIPSVFFAGGVFDPGYFASKFGGGIAKSIGELTITALALLTNTYVVLRLHWRRRTTSPVTSHHVPLPVRAGIAVVLTALVFLLLRGYAAVVRSAVFDSNLQYNDPGVIIPSFELWLMVFSLFVISFCLIIASLALTRIITRLVSASRSAEWMAWLTVAGLFVLASVLFGVLQETPLMSTGFRLLVGGALILFAWYIETRIRKKIDPLRFSTAVLVLALSASLFYPLLDDVVHEKDRDRVQVFARDVLRPVDAWLKFIVDESLHTFVSDEAFDILVYGHQEEIERLAFSCWARSTVAKQGYTCLFQFVAPQGVLLSTFSIGELNPSITAAAEVALKRQENAIRVLDVGTGVNALKIYSASIPVVVKDSLVGYGVVVVSAAQQSLFRGESPSVFRTISQENIETFYRPIVLSEFHAGQLFTTTGQFFPIGYELPAEVADVFQNPGITSYWTVGPIGDRVYESYYVRRSPHSDEIISLAIPQFDVAWHVFGIVRTIVYFAAILITSGLLVLLVRWLQGKPYRISFRDKLLVALLFTATIPVIVIAVTTRAFASERLMEGLAQRLNQEMSVLEEQMVRGDTLSTGNSFRLADTVSSRMKADFNYYIGGMLAMSSRPELYETGILDRRMSGSAFSNIYSQGKWFYLETENIGSYQYAVGYKPVVTNGDVAGVLSIPTLYREQQIDEEVARINTILFGLSAVIFLLIALIATTFANRIAGPIHKLTEATKRVSMGDLDVKVRARADGEIGELISSFEVMTRDLKASRENLVQYEREMAWKEMAKQVAHEIKNPLTPMKLALQHLRQTYRDRVENFEEIFEEVSQMVIRQVDALSRIASEFSSFARMPRSRLEPCSVNETLREAVYLFERDTHIHITMELDEYLPPILADREELRRAFINVIRNGIQAMNNEGRLIVTSARVLESIEVRIRDFGCGIPDEIKSKLFQPNFSTKTDGMGLGLAIVKKTIEDMHGDIAIESKVDEGTTVIISFPIHQELYGREANNTQG